MTYLSKITSMVKETEIPQKFAVWSGLFTISASVGRNIFLDMEAYIVYPNFFIVFVAGSGVCRKSSSVAIADSILQNLSPPPTMLSQKLTAEALVESLSESPQAIIINDELSTFMNKRSYEMGLASILIPLYDCKDEWSYKTRGKGIEKIKNCSLNCLFATTMYSLRECFPIESVGEGLTSRFLFVYEQDRPKAIAFPKVDTKKKQECISHLNAVRQRSGMVRLSTSAKRTFEDIYVSWYKNPMFDNPHLSGYASRRHIHLLKVAICLLLSENPNGMEIESQHIENANELLHLNELSLPSLISVITSSEKGAAIELIRTIIDRSGVGISRTELLSHVITKMDHREFESIISTLQYSGKITIGYVTVNGTTEPMYIPKKTKGG